MAAVASGQADAVFEYASLVPENSDYGGLFEKAYDAQYRPDTKLLLLAYNLPSTEAFMAIVRSLNKAAHGINVAKDQAEIDTEAENRFLADIRAYRVNR